jgi:hypothetical protein
MVIYSSVFHPNGFFVHAAPGPDFWVFLSKPVGWGRFSMIKKTIDINHQTGIFELSEVQQEQPQPPSILVHSSNVLWRLKEADEVLKQYRSSLGLEGWKL